MRAGRTKTGVMAVAAATLLFTGACHRETAAATDGHAAAAAVPAKTKWKWPRKHKDALPPPSPTAHLIVLPDSAISVERGSTEEALAAFLGSDAPAPRTFRFTGTEFEPWQSKPNPGTLRTMYAIAQILRAYPNTKVTLVGHTDNDGTPAQNIALSQARVDQMEALLVRGGINARRIATLGRGLADPVADNGTPAGRARNRRIELVVTAK